MSAMTDCSSWLSRRTGGPSRLRAGDNLTDVEIRTSDRVFRAHKVILAMHSDFFHNLLTSGMRESEESAIDMHDMNGQMVGKMLDYIYDGQLPNEENEESLEEVQCLMEVADMWQITDMEDALMKSMLVRCAMPAQCIQVFLYVHGDEFPLRDVRAELFRLQVEDLFTEMLRDDWKQIVSGECKTLFEALEVDSLQKILSVKSQLEEPSDHSFSFNQCDLCKAVVDWIIVDPGNRACHLKQLSQFFCIHQINSSTRRALDKVSANGFVLETCSGLWCPKRKEEA